MILPDQILITDLLRHTVRCDKGLPHGNGSYAWMHPPVHRILGWASSPSSLRLTRDVWRLNQLKAISEHNVYVKGLPSITDQTTLERLPTLLYTDVLNNKGLRLGKIVDLLFNSKTGNIINYLISRSDPRIPGTSRWRLPINNIVDQQPGIVSINILNLDELPLSRVGIRQNFLKKTQSFRDQIQDFSDRATDKLEGWLEEPEWNEDINNNSSYDNSHINSYDHWVDEEDKESDNLYHDKNKRYSSIPKSSPNSDEDPWI